MTDGGKFVYGLMIMASVYFSYLSYLNAREAHRHTHELACHVGAAALCEYHAGESHD